MNGSGEGVPEGAIRVQSVPQSTLSNGFRIRSLLPVFTRIRSRFATMTEVIAHTIADAVKISGIGRTTLYELIAAKKIDARKAGNRTLIPAESLRAYIAGLPKADIRTGQRSVA
jgi:excisionase family DNA binding protein